MLDGGIRQGEGGRGRVSTAGQGGAEGTGAEKYMHTNTKHPVCGTGVTVSVWRETLMGGRGMKW